MNITMKKHPVVVMKFGGAALANYSTIAKIAEIVKEYSKNHQTILIVSAIKGVTDALHEVAQLANEGKLPFALEKIDEIYALHMRILSKIDDPLSIFEKQQELKLLTDLLRLFVKKINRNTITSSKQDYIVSFGERLNIYLVTQFLQSKRLRTIAVDSSSLLTTTRSFGNANPITTKNKRIVQKLLTSCIQERVIPVMAGYIGHAEDGCVTTLGRGGSDYSATFIGSLIHADKVILWKDVKGLYDKDPKKYQTARYLKEVNYDTAISLSRQGAKVLHPESILPAKLSQIPVYIKCFSQPNYIGTKIAGIKQ